MLQRSSLERYMVSVWCLWCCSSPFTREIHGFSVVLVVLQHSDLERYVVSVRCLWCCSSPFTREIHGFCEVLVVLQLPVY